MFESLLTTEGLLSLATLIVMEIILGIDNIVFISIIADRLPKEKRQRARAIGLSLALLVRIGLLFSISWLVHLTNPIATVGSFALSARDIILLAGGIFLLYKTTKEIHNKIEGDEEHHEAKNDKPLTAEEKQRVTVIFILTAFVIFFWAGFEQAGSSLSLYTDKFIDRNVFGFEIPTSWFQSVNPLFIVALAPLFSIFWTSNLGKKLTTPVKMGLGMILLGIGFFFMLGAVAERGGDNQDITIKASLFWLVMTYLIHTLGELCLSPVGLSVVTKLAPVKLASLMMGVWMLATFVANIIGGFVSAYVESLGAFAIFATIAGFVIVLGTVMIALNKPILKMMHGVR